MATNESITLTTDRYEARRPHTEAATRMGVSYDFTAAAMEPVEMKMNPSVSSTNSAIVQFTNDALFGTPNTVSNRKTATVME